MASFLEELWGSIFTPGPTPTLLVATNAAFAALQFLLLILLIATYSIHFLVLSLLCGGLWYSINWFATEIAKEQRTQAAKEKKERKERSPEPENTSDTETEGPPPGAPDEASSARTTSSTTNQGQRQERTKQKSPTLLSPDMTDSTEALRRRRSLGESSGYVSTDSEWEKVSEEEERRT